MFLILQVLFVALYIVGVVRSRGVARILLAIWVAISTIGTAISMAAPRLIERMGWPVFFSVSTMVNTLGSALLGVALILGRPGHRPQQRPGQPQLQYEANPQLGYQGPPDPYGVAGVEQAQPSVEYNPYEGR